jgi:hypothetical protein
MARARSVMHGAFEKEVLLLGLAKEGLPKIR